MPFWNFLQSLWPSTSPTLFDELIFRLANITWWQALDLLLVTISFYIFLRLIQRSQVSLLLRGQLVLMILLFAAFILLPLPTFDWILLVILLILIVATPVIFQPELRRFFERIGRNIGISRQVRQTATEAMLPRLVRAVETMAANHTGALIALESQRTLQEVIETGVIIEGQVTSELLQAIFYPENPLHDGAVVLREDRIVAASCVLPLTERILPGRRRLGTRHRAAVGLSENSDALVIVVSEETGTISVAHHSQLYRPLDGAKLREQLYHFYTPGESGRSAPSVRTLVSQGLSYFLGQSSKTNQVKNSPRTALVRLGFLVLAFLLALTAWLFVTERNNPSRQALVEGIPLRAEDMPAGLALTSPLPETVSAVVKTTDNVLANLRPSSFQALVYLTNLSPGLYSLPVQVQTGTPQVLVLSVDPAVVDVELAPLITRTMTVNVKITDPENLSPAYRLIGEPTANPEQAVVSGPAPLVESVSRLQAEVSLNGATASFKRTVPLQTFDEAGHPVTGVTLQPEQVEVNVTIQRQLNAINVAVRPVTTGLPPEGYRLSGLSVTPVSVTLQGNPLQLAQIEGYINTLPIDISQATGDMNLQVPLDLPPDVQALDNTGAAIRTVTVQVQIVPRTGYTVTTRPVELLGITGDITATIIPDTVDITLTGPLPVLNQIQAQPELVRVTVDVVGVDPPGVVNRPVSVIAPQEIEVQAVPDTVQVILQP
jgi:diadenylate cyclase